MTVSVNPQNAGRTVSGRGKALFVLMTAVIAAAFLTAGCGGKASAKVGQKSPAGFWSGGVNTDWYDEDEDEFVINTAEELAGLAELVNSGDESFEGKTVRLGRDIIINDTANWRGWAGKPPAHQWVAIGTDEDRKWFRGAFDGGGHTVSGVYIKNREGDQGLFGVIGFGGKLKRLNVIASHIEGKDYVGLLVGGSFGVITGCHTSGIVVGDSIVGGLIGVNDGLINSSHAAGSVKGRLNVGGLIGANRSGAAIGNYSAASVFGDSAVGGFVGGNWEGMMNGNFSTGKVSGSASVGGFVGRGRGGAMRNNYYDRETSGQSDSGKGEGKTTAQMQSAELADSLNAAAGILSMKTWIRSDGGYPALSGEIADTINAAGFFASGKGTEDDPYIISAREHLAGLSVLMDCLGESFSGKHLKLGQDIAFNDTANWQKWAAEPPAYLWTPLGIFNDFGGTLDGGGHAISGIYFNMPEAHTIGLLRKTSGNATIKNLGITASYFRGHCSVGGLVGFNKGSIINSYSTAIVAAEEAQVGGLAGANAGGTITGCYATGAVSGNRAAGGLVGGNARGGTIRNCYSTGAVSLTDAGKSDHCRGSGGIGGLVGVNNEGIINACYTVSAVAGDGEYVGPLVGRNHPGKMSHNFFNSETSGVEDNDIGSGRTTEQMKQKETFAGWDFNTVWIMDPAVNGGYPYLSGKFGESAADDLDDDEEDDDDD